MAKAVIFDKDGVIIDSAPFHFKSFRIVLKDFGINLKKHEYIRTMSGRSAKENLQRLLGNRIKEIDIGKLLEKKDHYFMKFFNSSPKVVTGVIPFLKELKKYHMPMAMATSSRLNMANFILDTLKIRDCFDVIVAAEHVSYAKPDPEIYLTTAKKLNTTPSDCVVFEDSLSGIEAAKKAGMKLILVTTTHKKHPHVGMIIKDFTKITVNDIKNI